MGRCRDCHWWDTADFMVDQPDDDGGPPDFTIGYGVCWQWKSGVLLASPDFGCVLFEVREANS